MFLSQQQLTGVLLIAAFVSFAIGASLPVVGANGNPRFYALPIDDHLRAVAGNSAAWRLANVLMGTAAVILLAGLSLLTTSLESAQEPVLSRLGLLGWLLATTLWVAFSAFRAIVTTRAAYAFSTQDSADLLPAGYELMSRWAFGFFYGYAVIGYLALMAYGGSLAQLSILPAWVGWTTGVLSLAFLIHLLVTGDTLPAFHYLPPLLIGLLLVIQT